MLDYFVQKDCNLTQVSSGTYRGVPSCGVYASGQLFLPLIKEALMGSIWDIGLSITYSAPPCPPSILSVMPKGKNNFCKAKKSWTRHWGPKLEIYFKCYYPSKNNENLNFSKLNKLEVFIELKSTHRDHESSSKY